jgi:hypothetical protein
MTNLPIAQYVFKVRYISSYGSGAWSATYSFTVAVGDKTYTFTLYKF